jgi:hypothetical protein
VSERLDDADLAARRWYAEARILEYARSLIASADLDPEHASRIEYACRRGDKDALELALARLLEEIAARAG